jgi:alanyl-tRNA synthetase
VTFACGSRAIRAFQSLRDAVAGSVRLLSVLPRELPRAIERMQAETKDLRRTLRRFQEALASHEAARLIGASEVGSGRRWSLWRRSTGGMPTASKRSPTHIAAQANAAIALFSTASSHPVVIRALAWLTLDATAVLGELFARFGGRGGGKARSRQGGGLAGDSAEVVALTRQLLQRATST